MTHFMSHNLFNSLQEFQYAGKTGKYYSLPALKIDGTETIDTPIELDYYQHGGILPYVLRELLAAA